MVAWRSSCVVHTKMESRRRNVILARTNTVYIYDANLSFLTFSMELDNNGIALHNLISLSPCPHKLRHRWREWSTFTRKLSLNCLVGFKGGVRPPVQLGTIGNLCLKQVIGIDYAQRGATSENAALHQRQKRWPCPNFLMNSIKYASSYSCSCSTAAAAFYCSKFEVLPHDGADVVAFSTLLAACA